MGLWAVGNFMIINIAGLQSVPTELYEAARIDGAGALTQLRKITIPLISPVLMYDLVITLIATFQYFTQAYTLTNGRGDPNNATLFINLELFREAFVFSRMGYGAAIAWLLFGIVVLLTAALFCVRPRARVLRGRRAMTARGRARPSSRSRSAARSRGATAGSWPRHRITDVRGDPRDGLPVAAPVHGHDLVPAAVPDRDAGRAAVARQARRPATFEGAGVPDLQRPDRRRDPRT